MRLQSAVYPSRTVAFLAGVTLLIVIAALSASRVVGETVGDADTEPVAASSLEQFGEFEVLDTNAVGPDVVEVDLASALSKARSEAFGRSGVPEGSLLRVSSSDGGVLPLEKGTVVWVFRWGGLGEEHPKAFPGEDGKPNETVFVYNDYFLFVDALSGEVIASVQH